MTLEQAIAYIDDDELVEVTPKSIRLRKAHPRPERAQEGKPQEGSGVGPPATAAEPSVLRVRAEILTKCFTASSAAYCLYGG